MKAKVAVCGAVSGLLAGGATITGLSALQHGHPAICAVLPIAALVIMFAGMFVAHVLDLR